MNRRGNRAGDDVEEGDKGLLWKLPSVKTKQLGKLGPAFGIGAGCGFGFGIGLLGGAGIGPGIPGLQIGFGLGAGCGIGLGFGYGMGRGIAYDETRKYSNVGKFFDRPGNLPSHISTNKIFGSNKNISCNVSVTGDEIGALVDELVANTKKLIKATSKEVEKWRRS